MKKKSNVRQVIRQIVREEVAMAIKEVITELRQPMQSIPQPKQRVNEQSLFSTNSVINEVLNETAEAKAEWESLGGGTFDSSKMGEVMAKQYQGQGQEPGAQIAASMGVDPNNTPDFLKKDYSKLLKKVDEKAKQTRG